LTTVFSFHGTNGDWPDASLTLGPDGNFYGTTETGGSSDQGVVFKVTTNGVLTLLASFSVFTNGASPLAGLTLGPDGDFYGTTESGGRSENGTIGTGTIFRLDLPPAFINGPTNPPAIIGSSAVFNCQLFGTAPFAYQWLSNGVPIAGATGSSLTVANVFLQSTNSQFQVVVTNSWGGITSSVASINVQLQPNIYAISGGQSKNFTVYCASFPGTTNRLWATTNLALPPAQWPVIATNITDSNGLSQFVDTNSVSVPRKYYRLSYP
jgi:uncharacterized repeat protein (TIGR03803 family)